MSAWLYSFCLTALQAANTDGILWQSRARLERNGTERSKRARDAQNRSVCSHRSRFWNASIVIITSDIRTAGIMYVLVGSGFFPRRQEYSWQCDNSADTHSRAVDYRFGDSLRCVWLGRGRVCSRGHIGGPYLYGFQEIPYTFNSAACDRDIFIPSCWCVQIKNDTYWVYFKPIVALNWNLLNKSVQNMMSKRLRAICAVASCI